MKAEVCYMPKWKLKKKYHRGTPVMVEGRRGVVTGYGRESRNYGTLRVMIDGNKTSRLVIVTDDFSEYNRTRP